MGLIKALTNSVSTTFGDAMVNAAKNEGGAMNGFVGMGMAQAAGGSMMAVANANANQQTTNNTTVVADGALNFCPNCGTKTNGANFCENCGTKIK